MTLPEFGRVLFRKVPLALVLAQVRFPILPRFGEGSFIAPFQEALRSEYPGVSREHQMAFQLSPAGLQPTAGDILWRLTTRDKRWAVVLGETAVTLEVRGYSSIDELLARFERILVAACETLELSERARLGLRYVNEIRHPDASNLADWGKLLNPVFVGFAASDLLGGQVEHMRQELQVQRDDGILAIRHGLLADSVVEPATSSSASGPLYLIDLDYYDTTESELDIQGILAQLRTYNDVLYRLFRWTLSEPLYKYLEPVDAT